MRSTIVSGAPVHTQSSTRVAVADFGDIWPFCILTTSIFFYSKGGCESNSNSENGKEKELFFVCIYKILLKFDFFCEFGLHVRVEDTWENTCKAK